MDTKARPLYILPTRDPLIPRDTYRLSERMEKNIPYTEWSKSERKTPILYINAYIWNLEDGNDDPMCETARDTDVKNSLLDSVGKGKGGVIWENSIETCILYVKQIASTGSMHETGCSGLVHWDDPDGWDGEGGWRGIQNRRYMYTHGWLMSLYGKTHYNIVK